jgi:hypothetical protein
MPKTVRIYGVSRNLREAPPRQDGVEVWMSNGPQTNKLRLKRPIHDEWTRFFNLHSRQWILSTYPSGWHYYQHNANGRPIFLQKAHPDIPTSVAFPREEIQKFFATAKGPMRYFTCSVTWLIALAIYEGFERIELWGFELRDTKPNSAYAYERPCFAYWVKQARDRGVDVFYQKAIENLYDAGKMIPGDPDIYDGKLYGYSTKPEPDWNPVLERFE